MKKFILVLGLAVMISSVNAQNVLVGWHSFETTSTSVASELPDNTKTGFTGLLGNQVEPAFATTGGGVQVTSGNSDDGTYGENIAIDPLPTQFRAVKIAANDNRKRRVDFAVTNNSGADVTIGGIAFDYKVAWNDDASVDLADLKLNVLHLDAISDLGDGDVSVSLDNTITATDKTIWYSKNVPMNNMTDVILGNEETAIFRLELPNGLAKASAMLIDNLAIYDSTPTAIDSPTLSDKVNAFPTPATDVINISAVDVDITEVVLLDLTGKAVYQSSTSEAIAVSNLPKGLYILKLEAANGEICTRKVVIK
ncbi:T9SS type A sorting domain-containing protein [Labilibacter sediminis]|nr:T9SS type A sorting domain-containing protein [Labilibacter sediminis]